MGKRQKQDVNGNLIVVEDDLDEANRNVNDDEKVDVDTDEKDKEIDAMKEANGGNNLSVGQSGKKRKSSVDPTVLKARDVSSQLCYESITLIKKPETDLVWVLIEPRLRGQK